MNTENESISSAMKVTRNPAKIVAQIAMINEKLPQLKEGLARKAQRIQMLENKLPILQTRLQELKDQHGGDLKKVGQDLLEKKKAEMAAIAAEFGLA